MNKAVILARVSTLRQEKEGLSLEDIQLPELRKYAQENGFNVVKEFKFSESADRKIRKRFNEMLNFVKENDDIKAVITYRVDRITRNYRDAVAIDDLRLEYDKEIHFVYDRLVIGKDTLGRDITDWDTKVYLAKQYLNRLKEDSKISAQRKLESGEWPGKAPFGYTNVDLDSGKKWVEIVDSEAIVIQKIFEWYATGSTSMLEISRKVKDVFGLNFSKGRVDQIFKNPFYYGTMRYDGGLYPHNYEPIISKELFDRVQEVKAGYNKKRFKYAGLPYAYRGLIRCSECGCMITPEKKKGQYVYYHCTQYFGKHGAEWLREEELTEKFAELYNQIGIPEDVAEDISETLKSSHKDKVHYHNQMLKNYQNDYEKYESRIETMYEDKLDGSITSTFFEKKRKEYRDKQDAIQRKINNLQQADEDYYVSAYYVLNLANHAKDLFKSSEPMEKRQIIKLTLQNLELNGRTIDYKWEKPFDKIAYFADRQEWLRGVDSNHQPNG